MAEKKKKLPYLAKKVELCSEGSGRGMGGEGVAVQKGRARTVTRFVIPLNFVSPLPVPDTK